MWHRCQFSALGPTLTKSVEHLGNKNTEMKPLLFSPVHICDSVGVLKQLLLVISWWHFSEQ